MYKRKREIGFGRRRDQVFTQKRGFFGKLNEPSAACSPWVCV